ncbi:hypothetical protein ACFPRL_28155 [Pseudoclavibacter helvolus]
MVSVATRIEITKQLKQAYKTAAKSEKSEILDQFCATTGVSRVTARRYLTDPNLGAKNVTRIDRRHHRPTKYSAASRRVLVWLWRVMMYPCGKYMQQMLPEWIPGSWDIRWGEARRVRCGGRGRGPRGSEALTH